MNFQVHGPFAVTRAGRLVAHKASDKKGFWLQVNERRDGLPDACGCYIFLVGKRPWYVGLAVNQTFRREVFGSHKINLYNDALNSVKKGKPQILLLAKYTPGGRFAKPKKRGRVHHDIAMLENLLMGSALAVNQDLMNVKGTKLLRGMHVPGFLNSTRGKPPPAVRALRTVLEL